ncbi:hypothetical protein KC317_g15212, partial [Hortaea werneckii]
MSKGLSLPRRLHRSSASALRSATNFPQRRRQYATLSQNPPERDPAELDQVTTLSNGVRVATEALPGHFSGIGVYIDAGSRYENEGLRGVSHIIDRLAFKSTQKRSSDQMLEAIETLGGNIQCASSRESLMYQSATFNSAVPDAIAMLAETICEPNITDEEVAMQLDTADYEIGEIWGKPELILPELVHMAAYKDNTLGNPLLCPKERLDSIDARTVEAYRKAFFKPERIVVAFAGVPHAEAVKYAERYFGDMQDPGITTSTSQSNLTEQQAQHINQQQQQQSQSSHPSLAGQKDPSGLMSRLPFLKNMSTSAQQNATVSPIDPNQIIPHPLDQPVPYNQPAHYTGGYLTLPPLPIPPIPHAP